MSSVRPKPRPELALLDSVINNLQTYWEPRDPAEIAKVLLCTSVLLQHCEYGVCPRGALPDAELHKRLASVNENIMDLVQDFQVLHERRLAAMCAALVQQPEKLERHEKPETPKLTEAERAQMFFSLLTQVHKDLAALGQPLVNPPYRSLSTGKQKPPPCVVRRLVTNVRGQLREAGLVAEKYYLTSDTKECPRGLTIRCSDPDAVRLGLANLSIATDHETHPGSAWTVVPNTDGAGTVLVLLPDALFAQALSVEDNVVGG